MLLNGTAQHTPDPELLDAMLVAALSGMRIEEAYRLTVADTADCWFNVRDAKTRAGVRRVPIAMPASKRFGHYRKRVGVDEREPGRRQSNIDFHSLRRWFVTKARNTGIDRATVVSAG
jgi:integrase